MPIPTPRRDEEKDKFISRCIKFLVQDEGMDIEQAQAICYDKWRDKKGGKNEQDK